MSRIDRVLVCVGDRCLSIVCLSSESQSSNTFLRHEKAIKLIIHLHSDSWKNLET